MAEHAKLIKIVVCTSRMRSTAHCEYKSVLDFLTIQGKANRMELPIKQVVAALILRDGEVLATQRGYGEFKDGWEFPGGKVEPGETPRQALIREIREELGAKVAVDAYFDTVEYTYPAFHLSMRCYLCHVTEGEVTLLEHEAARWLRRDELMEVDWLPADITLVKKLGESGILA